MNVILFLIVMYARQDKKTTLYLSCHADDGYILLPAYITCQ